MSVPQKKQRKQRNKNVLLNTCKNNDTRVSVQFEQSIVLIGEIYRFWQVHADVFMRQSLKLTADLS